MREGISRQGPDVGFQGAASQEPMVQAADVDAVDSQERLQSPVAGVTVMPGAPARPARPVVPMQLSDIV